MPVDTIAWITALAFGLLLGWGVSRNPADRSVGVGALVAMLLAGIAVWLTGPEPGSQPAMAAVAMTFAAMSAIAVTILTAMRAGRR